MPLHPVESQRLYRQIADQLRALIRSGEFSVGTRLPAERDLASRMNVSRPSVREALIALEVEGLVEVRPGSGIHVIARDPAPSARRLLPDAAGPFEIMGARHLIEGELAALAAQHATKAQVDGLRDALRQMDTEVSGGAMPIVSDRLFHLRVAEVSGNGLLLRTVTNLYDQRNTPLFETMGQHFENEATWRLAIIEHRAVVSAIAAGKPAAARTAMHRHLKLSQQRFADAWPQEAADLRGRGLSRTTSKGSEQKASTSSARAGFAQKGPARKASTGSARTAAARVNKGQINKEYA